MKKFLVVLVLMSWTFHMFGDVKSFEVNFEDVELAFENIYLKDVSFCKGNEIIIETNDFSEIVVSKNAYKLTISADKETKISIELPITKRYQYLRDDGICKFDSETLNFDGDDVFVIISADGIKVKDYDDGSEVEINDYGIFVDNDNETIKIDENGLTIDGGNEDIQLRGLLGIMVSSFARSVVNTTFNAIGRTPDKVFKYVVNDEGNETNTVHYGWD
ncbi:hypothetical protein ACFLYJ_03815 [Candidatus Cloacimonadota bacterium]